MALTILKYYILWKMAQGGEHTINSLSQALRFYRPIIYQPRYPHELKTLKKQPIPKIDVGRALSSLEKAGLVKKQPREYVLGSLDKVWTRKANVYTITEQGKAVFTKIMEKYAQIEDLLKNRRHLDLEKEPFIV